MNVSSRIVLNHHKIAELTAAAVTSLEQTAEELHKDIQQAQVIPRDTGNLQGEAFFVDYSSCKNGIATLIHATPYARRLYFHPEYNFHQEVWTDKKGKEHEGNPNAKGRWFEDWLPGGEKEDFCKKAFKEFYRRNAGL